MRLNQIARKLNISTERVISFLEQKGIVVKKTPNTKLSQEHINLLVELLPEAKNLLNPVVPKATQQERKKEAFIQYPQKAVPKEEKSAKSIEQETTPPNIPSEQKKDTEPSQEKTVIADLNKKVSERDIKAASSLMTSSTVHTKKNKKEEEETKKTAPSTTSRIGPKKIIPLRTIRLYTKETKLPQQKSKLRQRILRPISQEKFSRDKSIRQNSDLRRQKKEIQKKQWRKRKQGKRKTKEKEVLKPLQIAEFVSTQELAQLLKIPVETLIKTCLELGIETSRNQRLDRDVIQLIAEAFNQEVVVESLQTKSEEEAFENLEPRVPVVVIMGHVDHGKTSLLDYIRKTKVTKSEAGGITQHIGAYEIQTHEGYQITFLDTPGHKAFTAMRARGAQITDVAIIVIAADDGVMSQTKEAIHHAQLAGIPIVFAFNKIDKEHANVERIKQQLAEMKLLVEDWGGKYQTQNISAKTGEGVDELLEKVLLEAEVLNLRSNPNKRAKGTVIEARLEKGRGYLVTILIQEGTLQKGDVVLVGPYFGKVKSIFNAEGASIKKATPSMPIQILGISGAPQAGQPIQVVTSEQEARASAVQYKNTLQEQKLRARHSNFLERFQEKLFGEEEPDNINVIIKGDADGSVEAIADMLSTLSTPENPVQVIHKAVGLICESDISLAASCKAVIVGFQTKIDASARATIKKEKVPIKLCRIIYEAMDFVETIIKEKQEPTMEEVALGSAEVLKVFTISRLGTVAGCIVREGIIKRNAKVRFIRKGEIIHSAPIKQLKREKDVIKEANLGTECGILVANFSDILEGDKIECFEVKTAILKKH